jgi:2',3'-cyclic-nucleotide 2'-phosphodiesterase/3'-nucleotidase
MADLYVYPNTLKVVRITGAEVREWLERSAGAFRRIDPTSDVPQRLLDDTFPSYNFDVIDGVTYQIDVTKSSRYDADGRRVGSEHRIIDLRYGGEPVADDQVFLVATNNYRAGGGGFFPGLGPDRIVIDAPDENRQVLANYIAGQTAVNPTADGNWQLAPINATVYVVFPTAPAAAEFAASFPRLTRSGQADGGYDLYRYDLSP